MRQFPRFPSQFVLIKRRSQSTSIFSSSQARLTDFGIGQLVSTELLREAGITETGFATDQMQLSEMASRTGTRLYMAPELMVGKPSTIQSDLYALGVMLYQMVIADLERPLAQGWERDVEDELLREDIAACIAGEPADRLPAADALARRLRTLDDRRTERDAQRRKAAREEKRRRRLRIAGGVAAGDPQSSMSSTWCAWPA